MSASMVSRWSVLEYLPVAVGDTDADDKLTDSAVQRLFGVARTVYFGQVAHLRAAVLDVSSCAVVIGDAAVTNTGISISVNVIEIFDQRFSMEARIRPADNDGIAAAARCSVSVTGGVLDALRNELIALAHAARHLH